MLRYMERSTIYYLKQKGWTNVQIAEFTGHHRDTIARVLREEVDKKPKTRQRSSAVAVFDTQIVAWLDENVSVIRMLEMARADPDHPYTGGETAFYDYVRKIRRARQQTPRNLALRRGFPANSYRLTGEKCVISPLRRRGWSRKHATSLRPGSNTVVTCMSVSTRTCGKKRCCGA